MSRCVSWDCTVPMASCHASSMFSSPFRGHGISPTSTKMCIKGVQQISFPMLPSARYSSTACWLPKDCPSESCQMHKWLPQSSLWQDIDPVYPTTIYAYSSRPTFNDPQSQRGELVQTWAVPDMGDQLRGTKYIWKFPHRIICQSYVSHLQPNYHCWVCNPFQRGDFTIHLLIGMIHFGVVQSIPQMLTDSCICWSDKRLSLLKVVCRQPWIPWMPFFWVLLMHVVQSGCFALCFPPCIFHFNNLHKTLCHGWIRGTCEIGELRVWRFCVGSNFR